MYFLYSLSLAALLLVSSPWWLLQMLRHGKYRAGLRERFGRVPDRLGSAGGCIWIHAVSVGEVLAVSGLIRDLQQRHPERRLLVSTTTATGQKLARERFGEGNVFYFPLDFAFAVRAYLRALRPELLIMAETEFWPNFLRLGAASGARLAVVNARISDRSFPRYRRLRRLVHHILGVVDVFLAQSDEDARRLVEIGAPAERVKVSGNLKFDLAAPLERPIVAGLRAALARSGAGPVLVCGSTLEGEEAIALAAFRHLLVDWPELMMVLAPRHPERFAPVAELLRQSGLPFWRRSEWKSDEAVRGGVFLLDSIGDLASMYSLADVAFVGGSLVPRGGHNILEPALFGVATIVGPHTENFRDIIERFRHSDAVRVVRDGDELTTAFRQLLQNEKERRALGGRAAGVMKQNAGATARTLAELDELLTASLQAREPARR